MTEAERLRDQAERCLRLARGASDKTITERLSELAAEYLVRAQALESPPGPQVPIPPAQDQPMQQQQQQQQQIQPKNGKKE